MFLFISYFLLVFFYYFRIVYKVFIFDFFSSGFDMGDNFFFGNYIFYIYFFKDFYFYKFIFINSFGLYMVKNMIKLIMLYFYVNFY